MTTERSCSKPSRAKNRLAASTSRTTSVMWAKCLTMPVDRAPLPLDRPPRGQAARVSHQGWMDAIAEERVHARRQLADALVRDRQEVVLLRTRPRLAILVRERQPRPVAAILAAAVHQRAEEHDRRAGGHHHVLHPATEPIRKRARGGREARPIRYGAYVAAGE